LRYRSIASYTLNSSSCSYHTTRHLLQHNQEGSGQRGESEVSLTFSPETGIGNERADHGNQTLDDEELDTGLFTELDIDPDTVDVDPDIFNLDPDSEALKLSLRKLMRNVPSSVAVVTVASFDPATGTHVPMGVAISSFTTVSMDPPTVSFNIKEPSKTLNAIRAANGRFRVHIPSANLGGATVVQHFCHGNHTEAYTTRQRNLKLHIPMNPKDKRSTQSMAPQIWNDDVQASMECTVTQELPVADHVIIVAKVDSMEKKDTDDPAILYVSGNYMRLNGSTIKQHVVPAAPLVTQPLQKVWECPQFPGEKERHQYMESIKTYLKSDASLLVTTISNIQKLWLTLPYLPSALGINLELLIHECREELGLNTDTSTSLIDVPVLSEFYGRVTASSHQRIVERAKAMVSQDDLVLSLSYSKLLQFLGASRNLINFLPTDIMKPLRTAGLVSTISPGGSKLVNDIYRLEAVQYNIIHEFRKIPFDEALAIDWGKLMERLGEKRDVSGFFRHSHIRLLTLSHGRHFVGTRFDISGEVSPVEIRVILRRVVHFLFPSNQAEYRRYSALHPGEVLRRVGVHPLITGMDIEYIFAKINHLYKSTPHFRDFAPAVNRMLDAWFEHTIPWKDLVSGVRNFVQNNPLRATQWSRQDKLAALGLHQQATVLTPDRKPGQAPPHLNKTIILDSLFAQELRDYHGRGTDEVNQAIADFLKRDYHYTVHPKPVPTGPEDASVTSGDELHEAMLADLNVDVPAEAKQDRVKRHYSGTKRKGKKPSLRGNKI